MPASTHTLVLGIGNTLFSDHGAGVHALRRVERLLGRVRGVEYLDGSTLSSSLLATLAYFERWIVLDAAQLERIPGTIETYEGSAMDEFLGRDRRGPHETDLARLLEQARRDGALPAKRALVAIQPDRVHPGSRTSWRVRAVLDEAAAAAIGFICHWGVEADART